MLKPRDAKEALLIWCDERGVGRGVDEFLVYIESRGAGYILEELLAQLQYESRQKEAVSSANVETAEELTDTQEDRLSEALSSASISQTTEENLLAGATLAHDGKRFDASISGRLQALKNHLHISHE